VGTLSLCPSVIRPTLNIAYDLSPRLFDLFITLQHRHIIAQHTNSNAIKLQYEEKENTRNLKDPRRWYSTNKYEVETFVGILLYMSVYRCPEYEYYWNIHSFRPLFIEIQNAMSCQRFEQILRYWKVSDPDEILDSSGPDFWKKLEPLATDIRASSRQYWKAGRNVSVDEQLIRFRGRTKHSMQLSTKVAGQSFKIYSLCEQNYMLDFLFTLKVRFISCFSGWQDSHLHVVPARNLITIGYSYQS